MEIVMAFVCGFLFMAAIYLILSRSLLRIIIGTGLLSHGAHLLILTMGGLGGTAPLFWLKVSQILLTQSHKLLF